MARNQLPDGVGKKIVEALKRQAEADVTFLEEDNKGVINSVPLTNIEELPEVKDMNSLNQFNEADNDLIIEEDTTPIVQEGIFKQKEEAPVKNMSNLSNMQNMVNMQESAKINNAAAFNFQSSSMNNEPAQQSGTINIPSNVLVLKNLIASLPVGVTKQTGAQIIRQTLEAMGIPMNNVLKQAQGVQEELNSSTRECMLKIQEHKTNIMQLEQSVQEYQKVITQINDLVSLFLLTDKK